MDLESCVFIITETGIVKVPKRYKYKYGVWQKVKRAGRAVPQTPLCCAQFLGLFSVQQPFVASWVTPNTLKSYWCQIKVWGCFFFYATSEACLCMFSLLSLGRLSLWLSFRRDCMGTGGAGSGEVSVSAASPLLCSAQLTHSSVCSEPPQTKMQ